MRHGLVLYDGDQQGREQDVGHLPVEEVHSVVGFRHHGGLVPAGGVVLHALWRAWSGVKGGETHKRRSHSVTTAAAAALTKHQDGVDPAQTASRQLSVFLNKGEAGWA